MNKSLATGSMDNLKESVITPLLKKYNLDSEKLSNYRPIANISFLSKLIERVVLARLNEHMDSNGLNIPNQSGYKRHHSTETLLVKVVNDILLCIDKNSCVVVLMLDLSAAFDTVDHRRLLNILFHELGIRGIAHKWFVSYLKGRVQRVTIDGVLSSDIVIGFGVPQGSVLGPILFNIYIRSFGVTVSSAGFSVQGYADDHQVCSIADYCIQ